MKDGEPFAGRLLAWFEAHGRKDLPWQQRPTPYRVWVSEIMLQQTRVQTVIPYYRRFMESFPDVVRLADAGSDEVLHHWSGLGYYARARNLQRAAILVRDRYGGRLPEDIDDLVQLPGIGRSTAGAILSLACGQRHAILDGNVKRVLARYHAVEGWPGKAAVLKRLWSLAEQATPQRRVAEYNQAMMDLGATLCTRSRPACDACPLADGCQARRMQRQGDYPRPRPARELPLRQAYMLLLVDPDHSVYLQRRPPSGIWGGLWSFPEFADRQALQDWCEARGVGQAAAEEWPALQHTFSHFRLDIRPHCLKLHNPPFSVMEAGQGLWYNTRQPAALGLAAPVQQLLTRLQERI